MKRLLAVVAALVLAGPAHANWVIHPYYSQLSDNDSTTYIADAVAPGNTHQLFVDTGYFVIPGSASGNAGAVDIYMQGCFALNGMEISVPDHFLVWGNVYEADTGNSITDETWPQGPGYPCGPPEVVTVGTASTYASPIPCIWTEYTNDIAGCTIHTWAVDSPDTPGHGWTWERISHMRVRFRTPDAIYNSWLGTLEFRVKEVWAIVHSFRTEEGPEVVRSRTWGEIKARYH